MVCVQRIPLLITSIALYVRRLDGFFEDRTEGELQHRHAFQAVVLDRKHQDADQVETPRVRKLRRTISDHGADGLEHF